MAARRTIAGSALLTAVLLAVVQALITGILGMHVMAGTHSAHSSATVPGDLAALTASAPAMSGSPSGHAGHQSSSSGPSSLQELSASNGAASPDRAGRNSHGKENPTFTP
ncbi:hypothetical protein [Paenarthrobacter nitroguajacolicus]|uniref:hypothetical protein n=1 Tax=Paenarthrobacter nitroguajacolicus TaxID=211146 RepID=UPI000AE23F94